MVAAATIGAAVVGGAMSSSATKSAAKTQAAGANAAAQAQLDQYYQTRSDLSPYRQTGRESNQLLGVLLGLPGYEKGVISNMPADTEGFIAKGAGEGYDQGYRYGANTRDQIIEGALANYRRGDYGDEADALQLFGWKPEYTQGSADQYGSLMKQFTGQDLQNDPGYQFGLNQGYQALDRRAAGAGNYFSGAALKAANRYGQDYAGTKFNEAYSRDAQDKNRIYSMLSGTANAGQNAAAGTGTAGANAANAYGNYLTQGANANAAGQVGSGNALNSAFSSIGNTLQWNQLLANNGSTNSLMKPTDFSAWGGGTNNYQGLY